jgi:mono/diheme cytochrome c family protein
LSRPVLTKALLDKQITETDSSPQRTAWTLLAVAAILLLLMAALHLRRPAPYVREVLSMTGNPTQGQTIFQLNCAGCHGLSADGLVGPSLHHVSSRKSPGRIIHQVISGETPPMPQFQPSIQEMADLLDYLESL